LAGLRLGAGILLPRSLRLSGLLLPLLLLLLRLPRFPLGLRRGLPGLGLLARLSLPGLDLLPRLSLPGFSLLPRFGLLASLRLPGLSGFRLLRPARFRLTLLLRTLGLAFGLRCLGALLSRIRLGLFAPCLLLALPDLLPRLLLALELFAFRAGFTLRPGALFLLAARGLGGLVLLRPLRSGRCAFIATLLSGGLLLRAALGHGTLLLAALFGQPVGRRRGGFAPHRWLLALCPRLALLRYALGRGFTAIGNLAGPITALLGRLPGLLGPLCGEPCFALAFPLLLGQRLTAFGQFCGPLAPQFGKVADLLLARFGSIECGRRGAELLPLPVLAL